MNLYQLHHFQQKLSELAFHRHQVLKSLNHVDFLLKDGVKAGYLTNQFDSMKEQQHV